MPDPALRAPDHRGGGLVNLVAEIEHRLTGRSVAARLRPDLAATLPEARSVLFVLVDGLGDHQLDHPAAAALAASRRGALDAAFSTQTTVNLATIATGRPPSEHGLIAWLLWLPELGAVVDTIWWFTTDGRMVDGFDLGGFLPGPNLAERLAQAGIEAMVVEPAAYADSPLGQVLHRGRTALGYTSTADAVDLALEAASEPGRFVFCYLPPVDAAAHAAGQGSELYADALAEVADAWTRLREGCPPHTLLVATADHGHVDVPPDRHVPLDLPDGIVAYGDSRVVYLRGAIDPAAFAGLPGQIVPATELPHLWGPGPVAEPYRDRLPDALLVADPGHVFLFPGASTPLVGWHGGLTEQELRIPLLVG